MDWSRRPHAIITHTPKQLLMAEFMNCKRYHFLTYGRSITNMMKLVAYMAGLGNNPVQVFATGRANHWEFLPLRTGFELSSSWVNLPGYGSNLNRNILDFMRWPQIDLGAQDLNDIQRPKSFQNK
jgi:hypothetical protein